MGFVNEYASTEDVEKYNLEGLVGREYPSLKKRNKLSDYQYNWTVDKENNIYLIRIGRGRKDFGNRSKWSLNLNGSEVVIETDYFSDSDGLYDIKWSLVSMTPKELEGYKADEIIRLFKVALMSFGQDGAASISQNTKVGFNF